MAARCHAKYGWLTILSLLCATRSSKTMHHFSWMASPFVSFTFRLCCTHNNQNYESCTISPEWFLPFSSVSLTFRCLIHLVLQISHHSVEEKTVNGQCFKLSIVSKDTILSLHKWNYNVLEKNHWDWDLESKDHLHVHQVTLLDIVVVSAEHCSWWNSVFRLYIQW